MKSYYECHVTMTGDREAARVVCDRANWRFSAIDGDTNLGDGVKLYATRQFNHRLGDDAAQLAVDMMGAVLFEAGMIILRKKVEIVIYDTRSSVVRAACDGACLECVR